MLKRKINKLIRNPKLFFKDMYKKRENAVKQAWPIKYKSNAKYTVVSAVFNVEQYLEQYFSTLTTQTLNFKNSIYLILVDDGSTDGSAQIIKKWQKKFPKNIRYVYKENGGQASARNLGLQYVETEWLTFIDPDDFVHVDYFKNTDKAISANNNLQMVVANIQFYNESLGLVQDTHPLKYRFKKENFVFPVLDLQDNINLSAAASFFRAEHFKKYGLIFNERVKPNFEDGKLIADYLLYVKEGNVIFADNVIYLYRKRESGDSTIDTSWKKVEKFNDVLQYGFIPMLSEYLHTLGYVPKHVQRTALYDMAWYIKYLINRPERTLFLTKEQKKNFQTHIETIFRYIDTHEILNFNLAGMWFLQKVGMLETFKKQKTPSQIVYIENVDRERQQILLSFFTSSENELFSILVGNKEIIPEYYKNTIHTFNDNVFVIEKRLWIRFRNDSDLIKVFVNNTNARISVKGKQYRQGILIKEVLEGFSYSHKYYSNGSWILMDRDTQADDNAEHLYRYIMNNHPEQECYFALNKDSHDWLRLKTEGFNLLEYGSSEFENKLRHSSKIISSHLDRYINNYFGDEYEYSKKFIFLQHGITQNDLSEWFNMKKNLQCMITATIPEYHSIVDDGNTYRLTSKEVVLTGFPRHDSLLRNNIEDSKIIVIMPTWRRSILGDVLGDGNTRELNKKFMETTYAQHWGSLFKSKSLKDITEQYGYKIVLAPHTNIVPYLPLFDIPEYIQIWSSNAVNGTMQNLFQQAKIMITDYSSVAFEMAILNKMVLYYQFDREEMYKNGTHLVQRGYFDYDQHGFGPVAFHEEDLLKSLYKLLRNNGEPFEPYQTRISKTFPFRDGNSCARVFKAIQDLDKLINTENIVIIKKMIVEAESHKNWTLVASRIGSFLLDNKTLDNNIIENYQRRYLDALFRSHKFDVILKYLDKYKIDTAEYWKAKIDLRINFSVKGVRFFTHSSLGETEDYLLAILAAAYNKDLQSLNILRRKLDDNTSRKYQGLLSLAEKVYSQDYQAGLDIIDECMTTFSSEDKITFKLELFAAYICMDINRLTLAHNYLIQYEQNQKEDILSDIAIARLSKLRNNQEKLFFVLTRSFDENYLQIPQDLVPNFLLGLKKTGNKTAEEYLLGKFLDKYESDFDIIMYKAEKLYVERRWEDLANLLVKHKSKSDRAIYLYVYAQCRLKKKGYSKLIFKNMQQKELFNYWKLAAEVAEVNSDRNALVMCLEKQLKQLKQ